MRVARPASVTHSRQRISAYRHAHSTLNNIGLEGRRSTTLFPRSDDVSGALSALTVRCAPTRRVEPSTLHRRLESHRDAGTREGTTSAATQSRFHGPKASTSVAAQRPARAPTEASSHARLHHIASNSNHTTSSHRLTTGVRTATPRGDTQRRLGTFTALCHHH